MLTGPSNRCLGAARSEHVGAFVIPGKKRYRGSCLARAWSARVRMTKCKLKG